VQAPAKSRYQDRAPKAKEAENDEELSELEDADSDDDSEEAAEDDSDDDAEEGAFDDGESSEDDDEQPSENEAALANLRESVVNGAQEKPKKRKRADKEEVEDTYMRKLAREEVKEEEQRQKKRKTEKAQEESDSDEDEDEDEDSDAPQPTDADFAIPKHESLAADTTDNSTLEVEKASRTVFLGNVSTECLTSKAAEKALKKHLESFIPDLADNTPPHKIESIRFRSTAFDNSLPKRAAFAKKEIKDSTTRSTNAYAVYTTKLAALTAVRKLNGTVLLKRHLHVDSIAHPAKIEHRRCVFVGNLPFVDDVSQTPIAEGQEKKKTKPASDVEEGLWTHFAKAGKIESVRVVRDAATRVGKGFAYVQFVDENGVEAALQFHEKQFPPMLPRKLRVTRCRADKKKDKARVALPSKPNASGFVPKMSAEQKSLQGRARSMLGKVAKVQSSREGFVFEGHRAKEGQGKSGLKFKGSGGGKKKGPNGRKSRSSEWKKKDGKK
jgi:nucleolar protein 12